MSSRNANRHGVETARISKIRKALKDETFWADPDELEDVRFLLDVIDAVKVLARRGDCAGILAGIDDDSD